MIKQDFITTCKKLLVAYKTGLLGQVVMPEDESPDIKTISNEQRIAYFTLPMALNYQRDSYKLWIAALKTFNDSTTNFVFDVKKVSKSNVSDVRAALLKYKLALQPNKHIATWMAISNTIYNQWGSFEEFFKATGGDFLVLKQLITKDFKKDFPYLSGPKIFNYWSFIISTYGGITLLNKDAIEIAPEINLQNKSSSTENENK